MDQGEVTQMSDTVTRDEMIDKLVNHMTVDELAEFVYYNRLMLEGRARKILEYMEDDDFRSECERFGFKQ